MLKNIFAVKRYHEHKIELVTSNLVPGRSSEEHVQLEVNRALAIGRGEMLTMPMPRIWSLTSGL